MRPIAPERRTRVRARVTYLSRELLQTNSLVSNYIVHLRMGATTHHRRPGLTRRHLSLRAPSSRAILSHARSRLRRRIRPRRDFARSPRHHQPGLTLTIAHVVVVVVAAAERDDRDVSSDSPNVRVSRALCLRLSHLESASSRMSASSSHLTDVAQRLGPVIRASSPILNPRFQIPEPGSDE